MPFLRKITGTSHTHSRSGSGSSIKASSQELNSLNGSKHASHRISRGSTSQTAPNPDCKNSAANNISHHSSSTESDPCRETHAETTDPVSGNDDIKNTNNMTNGYNSLGYDPLAFNDSSDTRKSSGGSVNSLSFDKLILSWDPTDPGEWNMQRVLVWFKFHEFPDSWISFFRKHQLFGHKFIRLLAYDNFALYEKYLPQSKNASYVKFQYLLKQTMKKNVTNNHIRQKSQDKNKDSRSSSDSIKTKNRNNLSQEDIQSQRSLSESTLTVDEISSLRLDEFVPNITPKTHQKTKSAGALYRRSFISLRGSSSASALVGKQPSAIKLNIPPRPPSITETTNDSTKSSSPVSPSYTGIFRRHQKSSSSESSLLNTIFGSNNIANNHEEKLVRSKSITSNQSNESPSQQRIPDCEKSSSSPLKQSPLVSEEKNSLWGKLKRRSQIPIAAAVPQTSPLVSPFSGPPSLSTIAPSQESQSGPVSTTSDISIGTLTPLSMDTQTATATPSRSGVAIEESTLKNTRNEKFLRTNETFNAKDFLLDDKFYPLKSKDISNDTFILITKDNRSFIPMNVGMINSLEEFIDSITLILGITHKNITIHLTDFGCEIGSALPTDILETLRSGLFYNTSGKLYVKDQTKINVRSRAATVTGDYNLRSSQSKSSVRSTPNSVTNSNDENSIITSSSDITSFDELTSGQVRRYPNTPSHYYDIATVNGEELNYWNIKEYTSEPRVSPKINRQNNLSTISSSEQSSDTNRQAGTFHVLRKDEGYEIDFNKRRESPYTRSELAPKREAPKPPQSASPQRSLSVASQTSLPYNRSNNPKLYRRRNSKPIPPPQSSPSTESPMTPNDTVINSYTPGSSHVLVPQPYKGANENARKYKSDESLQSNPVSSLINKKRLNRSDSVTSSTSTIHLPPNLLKRGNSKRIVSSASAADVFEENNITFDGAPALSDSDLDSDDSGSSDDIIWNKQPNQSPEKKKSMSDAFNTEQYATGEQEPTEEPPLERKMTLRPSPEVVYQNLERFFPRANLDKPVLEGTTPPASPKSSDNMKMSKAFDDNVQKINNKPKNSISSAEASEKKTSSGVKERLLRRAKTIRTIAHEASEARKQSVKLRRQNTKMWGTKTVEVTDKRLVSINKSKNSKGEYREFAWMKGEMIGKGSFGAVYLCLNVTTGEMMAVKQVEVPKYGSQSEAINQTVDALRSEVSTLKNLDHLNIVQYLGFEVNDNIYSLFLEYVAGGSVGSLIRMYGRFDEIMIKHLTTQVLRGLAYLHSRGILHRDMKADNLLLDQDGVCKISDFGISRKSQDIYSNYDMTMRGTVFWMAPEMVDTTQGYSAKVDIWSLGCVVLEMFAGKRPWSNLEVVAAMFKIGKSKSAPPIPEDTLPLISDMGRDFLDDCFKIDPEKRPTADKLLSHPFIEQQKPFDFKGTQLAGLIKSNDKLNSSKLRVSSQENTQQNIINTN